MQRMLLMGFSGRNANGVHARTHVHWTTVKHLQERYIPNPDEVSCAATKSGPIQLSFQNISGLLILCAVVVFVGLVVGKFFCL